MISFPPQTKNPEKYTKNKERSRLGAIEAERNKIWNQAVRQAQQLAAKHDISGKMFNVGEVVILKDGSVKSKKAWSNIEKTKTEKVAEEGVAKLLGPQGAPKKGKMSKRQQQKQAALQPRTSPPRPVLPVEIRLPEGEENFIAMWDITDEQIQKRLSEDKRKKSMTRKKLRIEQKAQKKINTAMKLLKKQTENLGQRWDPIQGRKLVMNRLEGEPSGEDSQEADSENDSQDEGQDIEEEKQEEEEEEEYDGGEEVKKPVQLARVEKESKNSSKSRKTSRQASSAIVRATPATQVSEPKRSKNLKRAAENEPVEEPQHKKSKKSRKLQKSDSEPGEPVAIVETSATKESLSDAPLATKPHIEEEQLSKAEKRVLKEEKRALKEQKRARKEENRARKAKKNGERETTSNKRKHEDGTVEVPTENELSHKKQRKSGIVEQTGVPPSIDKHDRFYTKASGTPVASTAAQWNPDALTGEAARKDKFLRLLGAGKANAAADGGAKQKSVVKAVDILKMQNDLERQYEAGIKMKHDGGGKRRGLGA